MLRDIIDKKHIFLPSIGVILALFTSSPYPDFANNLLVFIKQAEATFIPNHFQNISNRTVCSTFDNTTRTLYICDGQVNLSKINLIVNDTSILKKIGEKEWFLNANVFVNENSTFFINSTDVSWLKINSTKGTAYWITSKGNLSIDSTRISSWNSSSNSEAKIDSSTKTIPRSYILSPQQSKGFINITNSNISHLGYAKFTAGGMKNDTASGISYFGGDGSILRNNVITDNYNGWYTSGVSEITFRDNTVANSIQYGLYPHKYSENLQIINNTIHNSGSHGIICSRLCKNILIDENVVYNSIGHGIYFDQSITDSVIKDNIVYNNTYGGISIWYSQANTITSNSIYDNKYGIIVTKGSKNNTIISNKISNSKIYGIDVYSGSRYNKIANNSIIHAEKDGIALRNITTKFNYIISNTVTDSPYGFLLSSSQFNILSNNKITNSEFDFVARGNSTNMLTYTQSNTTSIKLMDNQSSFVFINEKPIVMDNNKKINNTIFSSSSVLLIKDKGNVKLEPLDMYVYVSSGYVNISSLKKDMESEGGRIGWLETTSNSKSPTKYVIGNQIPDRVIAIQQIKGDNKQIKANATGHIAFSSYNTNGDRAFSLQPAGFPLAKVLLLIFIAPIGISIILWMHFKKRRKTRIAEHS